MLLRKFAPLLHTRKRGQAAETFTFSSPAVMEFWGQNVDVFISWRLMVLRAVALFSFSGGREQIDFSFLFENPFCAEFERQPCVKNAHFSLFFPPPTACFTYTFAPFFSTWIFLFPGGRTGRFGRPGPDVGAGEDKVGDVDGGDEEGTQEGTQVRAIINLI